MNRIKRISFHNSIKCFLNLYFQYYKSFNELYVSKTKTNKTIVSDIWFLKENFFQTFKDFDKISIKVYKKVSHSDIQLQDT